MKVRFHPAAEAEHLGQVVFYESREHGLGKRYLDYFQQTIMAICESPARFAVEHAPNIRRARLRPFPLMILFRELDSGIQVLAVAHYRRRPNYWLGRLR